MDTRRLITTISGFPKNINSQPDSNLRGENMPFWQRSLLTLAAMLVVSFIIGLIWRLLFGFLIQKKIAFSTPDSPQDLISMKQKTYDLMGELHTSFMIPFLEKMEKNWKEEHKEENFRN